MRPGPPTPPADAVLWQEQVTLPELGPTPVTADGIATAPGQPDGRWEDRADVAVVGAGYAGLSAARVLAQAGRSVVVVEKGALGWGAHARNGGMAIPELKAGPAELERTYGELGHRMHAEVNEAFDHLEELIAREELACDYERTGQLYLAHTPRLVPYLRDLTEEHRAAGEPVHLVEGAALHDEIGSDAYPAGVVFERTGGLHPAKLHAGMVRLALDAGARIVDRNAATAFEDRGSRPGTAGGRFLLRTEQGSVTVDDLIITTNAYADGLLPELARRVLPIGSFIVATEPLDPAVAAEVSPRRRMFVDTKNLLFYWRLSPDDRMIFGGRRSLSHATVADAATYLAQSMRRIHPQLADVAITHRWGGNVAITLDRMPHVGQLRGAWYATGCNGSGVALNTWLGHRLGEVVAHGAPPPSFAELRHRPIPLHRLRRAYLPFVGQWFRYQDRA